MTSNHLGQYWRLLPPGQYSVRAIAYGYEPTEVITVQVDASTGRRKEPLDFRLRKRSVTNNSSPEEAVAKQASDKAASSSATPTNNDLSRVSGFLLLRKSTCTMHFLKFYDELISKLPKFLILDHIFLCL